MQPNSEKQTKQCNRQCDNCLIFFYFTALCKITQSFVSNYKVNVVCTDMHT